MLQYAPRASDREPAEDLHLCLAADEGAPGTTRRAARGWAQEAGVTPQLADRLVLLLSELVTNAVVHGGIEDGSVDVSLALVGRKVHAAVTDEGHGFSGSVKVPDRHGGCGLLLLDEEATRWGVDRNGQTRVWFEL